MRRVFGILGLVCVLATARFGSLAQGNPNATLSQEPAPVAQTKATGADTHADDHSEEIEVNRRLAAYTKWLAIATVGLVIIGLGQVYLFFRQANIMQKHAEQLGNLVASADNNSKAALRQADIAYSAMVAQFRPVVSVRSMRLTSGREFIRMAVGQLLDYSFLGESIFGDPHMAILVPRRPEPEIMSWLDGLKISVIWKHGRSFIDNAGGQFI